MVVGYSDVARGGILGHVPRQLLSVPHQSSFQCGCMHDMVILAIEKNIQLDMSDVAGADPRGWKGWIPSPLCFTLSA